MDTGSLDRFGCSGHWASSGCIRLLTAACAHGGVPTTGPAGDAAEGADGGGSDSQGGAERAAGGRRDGLALMPLPAFAALWERSRPGSAGAGANGCMSGGAAPSGIASSDDGVWHVPFSRLLPLEEAYGGLARELKAAGLDLSRAHYMLR